MQMDNNGESRNEEAMARQFGYFDFRKDILRVYTCSSPTRKERQEGKRAKGGKEKKEDPEDDLGGFY